MSQTRRVNLSVRWHGEEIQDRIPLDRFGTFSIGREGDIQILGDPTVGRHHADLIRDGDVTRIENRSGDQGKLRINHRSISNHTLTIGDMIRFGEDFLLQFRGNHLLWINDEGAPIDAEAIVREVPDFKDPGKLKRILDDAYLKASGGEFVGLLGPSGAGKTTLLKAISGLCPATSGSIILDGIDIREDASSLASLIGFVPQDDIVHSDLTVEAALYYSARLRLPRAISDREIKVLVESVCKKLGLEALMSNRIQNPSGGGLSGGQRKRVSVAVELLSSPRILFLDEPTSGLDPATEAKLMKILRVLANQGTTIVCTTHVVENAHLMDQLVVLVNGRNVFDGHVDKAKAQYGVKQLTDMYEILEEQAEAERALASESEGVSSKPNLVERFFGKIGKGIGRIAAAFQNDLPMLVSQAKSRTTNFSISLKTAGEVSTGLFREIMIRIPSTKTLLRRRMQILLTDPKNVALLALQPLVVGLIVGLVVPDIHIKLFFIHLTIFWLGCNNSAQEIVKELNIYRRERFVGLSIHSYLTSKVIFGMIVTLAQAAIIYVCVYSLSNDFEEEFISDAPWVKIHVACMILTAVAGVSIGLVISSLSRTQEIALFAVPLILIPQILFSGGVVPLSEWQDHDTKANKVTMGIVRSMPAFSSQRFMDTSIFYKRTLDSPPAIVSQGLGRRVGQDVVLFSTEDQLAKHYKAPYLNLRKDFNLEPGSTLDHLRPAYFAGMALFGFFVSGYWISALALKVRERE